MLLHPPPSQNSPVFKMMIIELWTPELERESIFGVGTKNVIMKSNKKNWLLKCNGL